VAEATVSMLIPWSNFYVIVGTSAATLTGLMFVAISLISRLPNSGSGVGVATFSTPSIVHFGTALLIATLLSAPWPVLVMPGVLLGIAGLGGEIYTGIVIQRVRHMTGYQPVMEDWLWHTILPFAGYAGMIVGAILLASNPTPALFIVGAGTLLLVFIGIHNAWDNVTYIVTQRLQTEHQRRAQTESKDQNE
jgi:hypothetical protein